ncbi:hypothetical protein B5F76_12250 [Desulfovibrio sp. An276]|nr:hypothetical protein B5F76_12250 [Desulfovibrio sp. An276]
MKAAAAGAENSLFPDIGCHDCAAMQERDGMHAKKCCDDEDRRKTFSQCPQYYTRRKSASTRPVFRFWDKTGYLRTA